MPITNLEKIFRATAQELLQLTDMVELVHLEPLLPQMKDAQNPFANLFDYIAITSRDDLKRMVRAREKEFAAMGMDRLMTFCAEGKFSNFRAFLCHEFSDRSRDEVGLTTFQIFAGAENNLRETVHKKILGREVNFSDQNITAAGEVLTRAYAKYLFGMRTYFRAAAMALGEGKSLSEAGAIGNRAIAPQAPPAAPTP